MSAVFLPGLHVKETEDNEPVVSTVIDLHKLITTKHLPAVQGWVQVRTHTHTHTSKAKSRVFEQRLLNCFLVCLLWCYILLRLECLSASAALNMKISFWALVFPCKQRVRYYFRHALVLWEHCFFWCAYICIFCVYVRIYKIADKENVVSVCSESLEKVCLCLCALTVLNTGVNTCSGSAIIHQCSYINA